MKQRTRYIVHVDMDAFFAAVEQRDNPLYKGKPVIIGSDPKGGKGRGIVAACSYEARRYGIHSAMPISIAYKKCPDAVFLRGDMEKYARVSDEIFQVLETFTPDIEPISVDEAFLDITGSHHLFGTPRETCLKIKHAIKKKIGLVASVGMAPNKMTAKIASDIGKPDGLVIVDEKDLEKFLHSLPVGRLWGVGEKSREILERAGMKTIGALAGQDPKNIESLFGKNGLHIWQLANGIDPREVEEDDLVRSISNEHTFDEDTKDTDLIENTIMYLSEKVSRRLRKHAFKCRTITLKIRLSDFKTFTRSSTVQNPTNFVSDIYGTALLSLNNFDPDKKAVRLVGVRASNLVEIKWAGDLFDGASLKKEKEEKLHQAIDRIKDRFGERSIGFRKT